MAVKKRTEGADRSLDEELSENADDDRERKATFTTKPPEVRPTSSMPAGQAAQRPSGRFQRFAPEEELDEEKEAALEGGKRRLFEFFTRRDNFEKSIQNSMTSGIFLLTMYDTLSSLPRPIVEDIIDGVIDFVKDEARLSEDEERYVLPNVEMVQERVIQCVIRAKAFAKTIMQARGYVESGNRAYADRLADEAIRWLERTEVQNYILCNTKLNLTELIERINNSRNGKHHH